MVEKKNTVSLTPEETLQYALENGIIKIDDIAQDVEKMKREQLLAKHEFKVWQNKEGIWMTYLPDEEKGRLFRKRKTKEELEKLIVEFYRQREEIILIADVFQEWVDAKLRYGEIQKQSYDRYCTDFKRFFPKNHSISKCYSAN
ncbi:hypothetical protein [Mediterraneibacter gnavus]|uniref:hypothetical protein n=1 Tax=Mediterraneibacter gnavus TaxID=33038 RepID=UPI003563E02E